MDFPFVVYKCFDSRGGETQISTWNADIIDSLASKDQTNLEKVINAFGIASAKAQGLGAPVTDISRLKSSDQRLYLLAGREQDEATGMTHTRVIGGIKVGTKKLFVRTDQGVLAEIEPLCCLDFYVHESAQRQGVGRLLFDHMLTAEKVPAGALAYDRPSPKLIGFLAKHFNLRNYVQQNNSFVVFDDYYRIRPGTQQVQRIPLNLLKQGGLNPAMKQGGLTPVGMAMGHKGMGLATWEAPTPKKLLPSLSSEVDSSYGALDSKGSAALFKSPVPLPMPPMQLNRPAPNGGGGLNMMSKLLPSNTLLEQRPDFYSQGKTLRPISPPSWQQQQQMNGKNPLSPSGSVAGPPNAPTSRQMAAAMSNSPASLSPQVSQSYLPPPPPPPPRLNRPLSPASKAGMAPSAQPKPLLRTSGSMMQRSGAATKIVPLSAAGPPPPAPATIQYGGNMYESQKAASRAVPATPSVRGGAVPATPAMQQPAMIRGPLDPFHPNPTHPNPTHPSPTHPAPAAPPPPTASISATPQGQAGRSPQGQAGRSLQNPLDNGQSFGQRWSRNNHLDTSEGSHHVSGGPRLATIPDHAPAVFSAPPPPPPPLSIATINNGGKGDSLDGFKADPSPRGNTPHPINVAAKSGPSFSGNSQTLPGGSRTVATPSVATWKMEFESTKWNKSMDMMGGPMGGPEVGRRGSVAKEAMKNSAINAATSHALNDLHPSTPNHRQVGMAQRAGTLKLI